MAVYVDDMKARFERPGALRLVMSHMLAKEQ
jgi:hypothetical protein